MIPKIGKKRVDFLFKFGYTFCVSLEKRIQNHFVLICINQ